MLPEMILVINFVQKDLLHPNEYMRAVALRLAAKLKYPQLVEPLVPNIVENLENRHTFVRRQAAACVNAIYSSFPELMVSVCMLNRCSSRFLLSLGVFRVTGPRRW